MTPQHSPEARDRIEIQQQDRAARASAKQAEREAAATQRRRENPQFVEQLRDLGLEDDKIESLVWIREEFGPLAAGAHATANRAAQQEHRIEWGLSAEAEQMLVERDPGRLCDPELRQLAHGTNRRPDANPVEPATPEERRHIRNAMEAIKALQSLGVLGEGLSALSEATVVNRTEKLEEEDESIRERAAGALS